MNNVRCPCCQGEEFFLVVERTWSFRVKDVGLADVVPGELFDEISGKGFVCDNCGFDGWIDEFHQAKSGVITLTPEEDED